MQHSAELKAAQEKDINQIDGIKTSDIETPAIKTENVNNNSLSGEKASNTSHSQIQIEPVEPQDKTENGSRASSSGSDFSDGKFTEITLNKTMEDLQNWFSEEQEENILERSQRSPSIVDLPDLEEEDLEKERKSKFESKLLRLFRFK